MPEDSQTNPECAETPAQPPADVSQWVRQYHAALYRYAYRLTGSVPDAEDLTQQTFLIAQRKTQQVRETGKVRAWLFTILRSCFLKSCRKKVPLPTADLEYHLENPGSGGFPRESEIDTERLQLALNELVEEFRVVLAMFYFEDYSYKEIAQQLQIPIGTVMSRLSRAKSHLRQTLLQMEEGERLRKESRGDRIGRGDGSPPIRAVSESPRHVRP